MFWQIVLGYTVVWAVAALAAALLWSPYAAWPPEQFNKSINVGRHPRIEGFGSRWTTAGLEAQRDWWARAIAWGLMGGVFAVLFALGASR